MSKENKLHVQLFPEFAHISKERLIAARKRVLTDMSMDSQQDEILSAIFAPDPVTGVPRSDLALVINSRTRPEVASYIRDVLQRPINGHVGLQSADEALKYSPAIGEDFESYATRLRELCTPKPVDPQPVDPKPVEK